MNPDNLVIIRVQYVPDIFVQVIEAPTFHNRTC